MAAVDDIKDVASRLLKAGPHKTHPTSQRRIRVVFNGKYIVDTVQAVYVWEHPYYPFLYVPTASFRKEASLKTTDEVSGENGKAKTVELGVGGKSTDRVIAFEGGILDGLTRLEFRAMDAWFEEDSEIFVHPKDVFKRVDVLPSSRPVKVSLEGTVLAEAAISMHLYETLLPPRYYLPKTEVKQEYLRPSKTRTACPYKGEAEYYDVVIPVHGQEKVFKDLVWYYTCPNLECAAIKGMLCFYNEKVDVWVDGEQEERPKSKFA